MAGFVFPESVYDRPENLLSVLGSWWVDEYAARDQVSALVDAKCQAETQTMLDLLELISSLSRFSVPIYHTSNWYPLYLKQSELNTPDSAMLQFDSSTDYGDGHQYDAPRPTPLYSFPKPADLVEIPLLMNRFADPTLVLSPGIDFILEDDAVVFLNNPFNDVRVAKRTLYEDGVAVDTEALIWVFQGQFDWDTVYRQFGYVLGLRMASSAGYRDVMNAIYDGMVGGPTRGAMKLALSAMTGVPLVRETTEVVEDITADADKLLIITDQHVYTYGLDATPIVEVGDTVQRCDVLTDALRIYELNTGTTPTDLAALALGEGMLATCYYSDLVFENQDLPITVETDHPSGYTKVSWPLGGFPLDVAQFFDDMHARGVEAAEAGVDDCAGEEKITYPANDCDEETTYARVGTIAHLLDTRQERIGEPKAAHLPATINPLQFLVENVLRNNAWIVRIKAAAAQNGTGLGNAQLLRKIAPPHSAMLVIVDLTVAADSVTVTQIDEELSLFTGMEPLADSVPVSLVSDQRVAVRIVNGTCQ